MLQLCPYMYIINTHLPIMFSFFFTSCQKMPKKAKACAELGQPAEQEISLFHYDRPNYYDFTCKVFVSFFTATKCGRTAQPPK